MMLYRSQDRRDSRGKGDTLPLPGEGIQEIS